MTSEAFTCGHASSPNWRDAAAQCLRQAGKGPAGANLGFLYVTDNFAGEVADLVAYFRTNTGILHWSGTVGMGVIATGREYYDEPAVRKIVREARAQDYRFSSLVLGIVNSAPFEMRRTTQ